MSLPSTELSGLSPDSGLRSVLIPTRTEKQAMDWSLALASQSIPCAIRSLSDNGGWALEVDARQAGLALRTLRIYHRENRRWHDAFQPTAETYPFQWSVILWCILMMLVHSATTAPDSRIEFTGRFETALAATGEWWRPITATFLHAGLDHLVANLTTGFIVLGLAIGRFGTGPALFLSLLAGILSNLIAWLFRAHDYIGLGASGVVMGALGMLAVSLLADAREGRASSVAVTRGLLGGVALFILLGTAPQSDVLAHAAGFAAGVALAGALAFLPLRFTQSRAFDLTLAAGYLLASTLPWIAALR